MKTWYWAVTWVSCITNPLILPYFLIWYIYSSIDKENNYFRKDYQLLEAKQTEEATRIVTHSVRQYQSKTLLKPIFYCSVLIWLMSYTEFHIKYAARNTFQLYWGHFNWDPSYLCVTGEIIYLLQLQTKCVGQACLWYL